MDETLTDAQRELLMLACDMGAKSMDPATFADRRTLQERGYLTDECRPTLEGVRQVTLWREAQA